MEDAAQFFRRRWSHALGAGLRQAQAGQGILRQDAHFHRPIERGSQDGDAPVDRRLAKAPRFLDFHELEHVRAGEARCLARAINADSTAAPLNYPTGKCDDLILDTSRVIPTANEIRPANVAVRYLVRARP